ncbi:hypothetical protein JKP88DRAFT_319881 [Tribonema minus]|uniref:Uncharacterized protein n=1 Tax=Tribonema minus TaxID=303371 RepID=A0A835YUW6_9STRA|nr:hypothetical protein JKP88DRAFT_319881 [Tribonema minus]
MAMTFRPTASLLISKSNILIARDAFSHKCVIGVTLVGCLDEPLWFLQGAKLERLRIEQRSAVNPDSIAMPLRSMHVRYLVYEGASPQGVRMDWVACVNRRLASVHRVIVRLYRVPLSMLPANTKSLDVSRSVLSEPFLFGSYGADSVESVNFDEVHFERTFPDLSRFANLRELTVIQVGIISRSPQPPIPLPDSLTYLELGDRDEHFVNLQFTPLPEGLQTLCLWSLRRWPFRSLPQGLKEVQIASARCHIPPSALPASLHTLTLKASAQYKPGDPHPLATYPVGLKVLKFECDDFPYPIGPLREGLETLVLPAKYSQRLGTLPARLKFLTVA